MCLQLMKVNKRKFRRAIYFLGLQLSCFDLTVMLRMDDNTVGYTGDLYRPFEKDAASHKDV